MTLLSAARQIEQLNNISLPIEAHRRTSYRYLASELKKAQNYVLFNFWIFS